METSAAQSYRISVNSIGNANAGIVDALRRFDPRSPQILAQIVYQAPSTLIEDLELEQANRIKDLLQATGLELEVEEMGSERTEGGGDYEIALSVTNADSVPTVAKEVSAFLGIDITQALKLVCSAPAVLLGRVSLATVDAVRSRFEALGVNVDVSRPSQARYDLFIVPKTHQHHHKITELVSGIANREFVITDNERIIVNNVNAENAEEIMKHAKQHASTTKISNHDYQRFDVRLVSAPNNDETRSLLVKLVGIPQKLVEKVIESTPIILEQNADPELTDKLLVELKRLGVEAEALCLPFWNVRLDVTSIRDKETTKYVLGILGNQTESEITDVLNSNGSQLGGRYTRLGAEWIRSELSRIGTKSEIV